MNMSDYIGRASVVKMTMVLFLIKLLKAFRIVLFVCNKIIVSFGFVAKSPAILDVRTVGSSHRIFPFDDDVQRSASNPLSRGHSE